MAVDKKLNDPLVQCQVELFGYINSIDVFCTHVLPFIETTIYDRALRQYFNLMSSTCKYLEKVVVDNPVFHAQLPQPKKHSHKGWRYY